MITTDLSKEATKLDIPVYFFSGIYDYTVNYTLAKDYFEKLQAPVKGFTHLSSRLTARYLKSLKKCARLCSRTCW